MLVEEPERVQTEQVKTEQVNLNHLSGHFRGCLRGTFHGTRRIGANPEKSDLLNFRGWD